MHSGLNPDNDAHLWLLHHLFLPYLNDEISVWIGSWNQHTLGHKHDPYAAASPLMRYVHGAAVKGARTIFLDSGDSESEEVWLAPVVENDPDLDEEDVAEYGIDWEDVHAERIMRHHRAHAQPDNLEVDNPFVDPFLNHVPERLSHVGSEDPRCLFTDEGMQLLDTLIQSLDYLHLCAQSYPEALQQLWVDVLGFAADLIEEHGQEYLYED